MIITSIQYTFAEEDSETAKALMSELRDESHRESGVVEFEIGQSQNQPVCSRCGKFIGTRPPSKPTLQVSTSNGLS